MVHPPRRFSSLGQHASQIAAAVRTPPDDWPASPGTVHPDRFRAVQRSPPSSPPFPDLFTPVPEKPRPDSRYAEEPSRCFESRRTRPVGLCSCRTCFCIRSSNRVAIQYGSRAVRSIGVVLVGAVRNNPAVLLARNESELEYGLTAGPRFLEPEDGDCYERAALRILMKDANICEADSATHVRFFDVRRLFPSGIPVLVGKIDAACVHQMDEESNFFDDANTRLFRIDRTNMWRVSGSSDYKLVKASVRDLLISVSMDFVKTRPRSP